MSGATLGSQTDSTSLSEGQLLKQEARPAPPLAESELKAAALIPEGCSKSHKCARTGAAQGSMLKADAVTHQQSCPHPGGDFGPSYRTC